jgi:hypothetical protein
VKRSRCFSIDEGALGALQDAWVCFKTLAAERLELKSRFEVNSQLAPCSSAVVRLSMLRVILPSFHSDEFFYQCLNRGKDETFKSYAACFAALYCSKECQKADWKNHRPFCKAMVAKLERKCLLYICLFLFGSSLKRA